MLEDWVKIVDGDGERRPHVGEDMLASIDLEVLQEVKPIGEALRP